ncbi:MAG: GGDEF domain-containing protein [Halopseudomonas sp.]|uniref:GGDEF domain-containing protein n=1 Tax=Halopseudomonas sp. TaxID=2901191 RepID=UPI0030016AC0
MPFNITPGEQTQPVSQQAVDTVLDSLDALVYVADMQTHELIFLNAYGRQYWGVPNKRKCWQVLQQGQTGPCSFCTNARLLDAGGAAAGVHVWEFRNTVTQRWYQCRDQAIQWPDGRLVRMEIATDITELKDTQAELKAAKRRAEELAHQDELTGLFNRRAFIAAGHSAVAQANRLQHAVAVVVFDADHFKSINDNHGHAGGDIVLRHLAQAASAQVRAGDTLARIGGEEFALLLPGANAEAACRMAERMRQAIAQLDIVHQGKHISVSCSFGVTASDNGQASLEQLMSQADKAAYRAKGAGRNRVELLSLPAC